MSKSHCFARGHRLEKESQVSKNIITMERTSIALWETERNK